MTKILLIVEGQDIAIDDDCVHSLDSKINEFKNNVGLSNNDCDDNSNESTFCFVDKSNTRDHNLTLRLKDFSK